MMLVNGVSLLRWSWFLLLGPAAFAGTALAGQSTLAFHSPRGLIASTGNLYWTSTLYDEFGPDSSVVWRASKGNVPGSELPLYSESGVDAGGIRSVPLAGGPVTTLRSSTVITRLRVDSSFIYYGEEFLIFRMPKAGGSGSVVVSTSGRVSALHVDPAIGWLFWGEIGGGVRASPSSQSGGGAQVTYQQSIAGRDVTAVGWDGSRVLWTDCAQPGNTSCRVMKRQAGVNQALSSGGVGNGRLQWDTASLYWGDAGALRKFVH